MEIWTDVVGYEGIYSVSNFGRIRRDKSSCGTQAGRILKNGISKKRRYFFVTLFRNMARRKFFVHTLVANAFIGACPSGKQVNHKDTNRFNNALSNLEYVTHKENANHAVLNGLYKRGESIQFSKLKEEMVLNIRREYDTGISQVSLADKYNICQATISQIVRRVTWTHI